jgi:hypothetical protein
MKITGPDNWRDLAKFLEHRTVNVEVATVLGSKRPSESRDNQSVTVALSELPNEYLYALKLNENLQLHHDENPRDVRRRSAAKNQKINFENIYSLRY